MSASLDSASLPLRWGRYEVVRRLGEGGWGRVFEAALLGPAGFRKPVALKLLPEASESTEAARALLDEARVGARLHHPHVVEVYDLGLHDGVPFVAMEFVDGAPASALLARFGPFSGAALRDLGLHIAQALEHVHERRSDGQSLGLVHQDVKPSNILVARDGRALLADFGLARARGLTRGRVADRVEGTLGYVAPEVFEGLVPTAAVDVFALGVTLAELATGERLFGARTLEASAFAMLDPEPRFREVADRVDAALPGLAAVVSACLARNPTRRPAAAQLAVDLAALEGEGRRMRAWFDATEPPSRPSRSTLSVPRPGNAKPPGDQFVGREDELRAAEDLLADGGGVITVVGPGGAGKTRFALELCARRASGGWVVELEAITREVRVVRAVGAALGLDTVGTAVDAQANAVLLRALAARGPLLLVLDNAEQVLAPVASLVQGWTKACPALQIVVTSREPLGIRAERLIRLGGLSTADADALYRARCEAPAPDGVDALLARLKDAELICLDTETDALDAITGGLVGLSFAVEPGEAWYLPVAHDYLGAPDQLDRQMVLDALRPVLEAESPAKVGQHIKYDINVLAHHGIALQGVNYDTMLESYVLDPTAGRHDMDSLAERVLGLKTTSFTDIAGKGKKQLTFNQIDLEQATPYAAEDADITLRLHQALWSQLSEHAGQKAVFESLEVPLIQVLARVERHGVLIDAKHLQTITREMAERMRELEQLAYAAAEGEFNLNSPGQLKDILFDRLGLPVKRKTPKGQPSTAEDVLSELAQEHPLPQMILDWRGLAKLRSTYTEKLPERINPVTGRVHTSYHQAVAATGRLSSSEPNLQNIPIRTKEGRRIREAFVAPEGHKLVAIDYSQIELRLMAHFSGDESMIAAFVDGRDIHRNTAAEVWGLALDAVSDEQRRAAKAINFGLIYGISAFGLARNLNIGRDEAQSHMNAFFSRYPGVKDYMERCKADAKEQGYVETLAGRRLYLPDIRARNQQARQYAERTAINAPLQGTAADLIKQAMIDIDRWLAQQGSAAKMIMQVHDELVFEIPDAEAQDLAKTLAGRMEAVGNGLSVPLVAEFGIGANWDEAHG